jgi:hypothetical protein
MLSPTDSEALGLLNALTRNWELRRTGAHFVCVILSDAQPSLRQGEGETIAGAVAAALEDLEKHYV